jgi:phosphoribosylformylglycinamidine cyclo-ligase
VVRTIAVNGTMTCRWPKNKIITNNNIKPGNVIVGFSSFGQSTYENEYNSGIGSNGLTSARHDSLSKHYAENFKESYDPGLQDEVVYIGKNRLTDNVDVDENLSVSIGKLLLSPTRTYAPLLKTLLENHFDKINGIIHCSGGGQTKCLKYLPGNFKIIKDNLFSPPAIFNIIKENSGSSWREMFEVFNMGCRLEIYCDVENADIMIEEAKSFGVDAKIIGRVEADVKKSLEISFKNEVIVY